MEREGAAHGREGSARQGCTRLIVPAGPELHPMIHPQMEMGPNLTPPGCQCTVTSTRAWNGECRVETGSGGRGGGLRKAPGRRPGLPAQPARPRAPTQLTTRRPSSLPTPAGPGASRT